MTENGKRNWGVVLLVVGLALIGGAIWLVIAASQGEAEIVNNHEPQLRLVFASSAERAQFQRMIEGMRTLARVGAPIAGTLGVAACVFGGVLLGRSGGDRR